MVDDRHGVDHGVAHDAKRRPTLVGICCLVFGFGSYPAHDRQTQKALPLSPSILETNTSAWGDESVYLLLYPLLRV